MAFVTQTAIDLAGNPIVVRYEGPKDAQGRLPVGYLAASGALYVNPMYSIGSRRDAHLGMDKQGNEGVSDQRWIYDLDEAARLAHDEPTRFHRVQG